jgi:lipopolysaccharide export system permease protein
MKVVELYILRRAVGIFAATLFWVLAIVWTTQVLTRINVVTGTGQSAAAFFELAWLVLPAVIPVVIPFAIGIAVAQTLTTMNTDSELVVISASGAPRSTVMRPLLLLAVFASLVSFGVNNFVEPYSRERLRVLISDARAELLSSVIQEGSFQRLEGGLHMQISERLPDGRFGGIFVSDARERKIELIYYAKTGATMDIDGRQLLVMEDGVVHRKTDEGVSIVRYKSYALDLAQFAGAANGITLYAKDRDLFFLLDPDPKDPVFAQSPQSFRAELHARFSEWLFPLVFALVGLAVAGDSRSFREARIHPLLTTMTIATLIRWGGFFSINQLATDRSFTAIVYLVPLGGMALATFFIATNRVLELPTSVTERVAMLWSRLQRAILAQKISMSGWRKPAPRGSA